MSAYKDKVKDTLNLLRQDTFVKTDVIHAIKQAASKFADSHEEETRIAEALYNRMIKE